MYKGFQKDDKNEKEKQEKDEESRTCSVMCFSLGLFMIKYNKTFKNYRADEMLHFHISHLCSVWSHHLQPGGDAVCVFQRTIRS